MLARLVALGTLLVVVTISNGSPVASCNDDPPINPTLVPPPGPTATPSNVTPEPKPTLGSPAPLTPLPDITPIIRPTLEPKG